LANDLPARLVIFHVLGQRPAQASAACMPYFCRTKIASA
jgi:hypothetical protein